MSFDDASRYDAWFETPLGRLCLALEHAAVLERAAVQAGEAALDLGCGTGNFTRALAQRGAQTVGIDASPAMIDRARSRSGKVESISFELADAADLPLASDSFDLATAVTLLCFTRFPEAVISEAFRVLKPGGRLVLGELNRLSYWAWLRRAKGWVRPSSYRNARFFGPGELAVLLRRQGFQVGKPSSLLFFPPLNRPRWLAGYSHWEHWGGTLLPWGGAFLVIAGSKSR